MFLIAQAATTQTVRMPTFAEGYTLDQFRKHLELYKDIDKAKLRENFAVFLKAIIPVAEHHPVDAQRYDYSSE